MQETFRAIIQEMGGTPTSPMPTKEDGYGIAAGGRIIHEVGVTRMGSNPSTSVLNKNCQAHDVKNLFVADGGPLAIAGRQELHVDNPRALDADGRIHCRRAARGNGLVRASPGPRTYMETDRRTMLRLLGRRSRGGRIRLDRSRGAGGAHSRAGGANDGSENRDAVQAEVLQRARVGDDCDAGRHDHSQRTIDPAARPTPRCRSSWIS